ncbi:hypothetical protein Bhyg_04805, partial [Pseudolycoriella hygida]
MCCLELISFFVLPFPPPFPSRKDIPQEKWDELTQVATMRLEQLAEEQGHHFKLIQIQSAQEELIAGRTVMIRGKFQTSSGEQDCKYDLWRAKSDGFEEYNLFCGSNEYRWSLGKKSAR